MYIYATTIKQRRRGYKFESWAVGTRKELEELGKGGKKKKRESNVIIYLNFFLKKTTLVKPRKTLALSSAKMLTGKSKLQSTVSPAFQTISKALLQSDEKNLSIPF